MFNLGGDDKEKLKENMEEIKDLVNSQHEQNANQVSSNTGPNTDSRPQDGPEPDIPEELDADSVPETTSFQNTENNTASSNSEQSQSLEGGTENNTASSNSERSQSLGGDKEDLKKDLKSISNEVKQLDKSKKPGKSSRPSGSSETVFLEVDEFQDVREKVEEMRYLSREMKDLVGNLEEGVDEDRRIEGEAQDVLDDFSERRESIQTSIK